MQAGKYDVKYYAGKFNAYQRTYVLSLKENWSYRLFQYQLEDKLEVFTTTIFRWVDEVSYS